MKKAIVIKSHKSNYPSPIKLSAGDMVKVEKRESEWKGWLWCITENNKGWIPDSYVDADSGEATVTKDYDATEMNVAVGNELLVYCEVNGWAWCENKLGMNGWVPLECLDVK